MKIHREARRQAHDLFKICLVNKRLDESRLHTVFDRVSEVKPRFHLDILKEITRLVRLEVAKHHAIVHSASPLSPSQIAEFKKSLTARFGEVTTEFSSDPSLIGGVRIQLGSDVWDGTVLARLQALKN